MTYAQLDDGFYDHPNFAAVPDDLVGIWAKGLAYCNHHLTDGKIPRAKTRSFCVTVDPETIIQRMVGAGLWREDGDVVWHIGYLDHNPSRAHVKAKLKKAKARKDKWKEANTGTRSETRLKTVPEHVADTVPDGDPNGVNTLHSNTDKDPPTPNVESVRETARRAFGEGIRAVIEGAPFTVLDNEADVLMRVIRDDPHLAGKRGETLANEIRRSAARYARARGDDAKFEQGLSPAKWAQWRRTDKGSKGAENAERGVRESNAVQVEALRKAGLRA